jgi:hypothetical protein
MPNKNIVEKKLLSKQLPNQLSTQGIPNTKIMIVYKYYVQSIWLRIFCKIHGHALVSQGHKLLNINIHNISKLKSIF